MHVGLIGFGSIGRALVQRMPQGLVSEFTVMQRRSTTDPVPSVSFVTSLPDLLARNPDLVVECAGHEALRDYLPDILMAGIPAVPASLGAFSDPDFLRIAQSAAKAGRCSLIFPSGAIGGLDILRALLHAGDVQVSYRGTKPPRAWKGSPAEAKLDLDRLTERTVFYEGTAGDAARDYPKNANVVAALALAGPGFDKVRVELIADPDATGNTHSYDVSSPVCSYHMTIDNAASKGNARTSETTVLSLIEEVRIFAQGKDLSP